MPLDFNVNKLNRLVKSFYLLTQVRIVVFDENFEEILAYPKHHSEFCEMLNRDGRTHAKCRKSAARFCERCKVRNSLLIDTCHAGLTEVVAPLVENGEIIGYIMFGQITNRKDREGFIQSVREKCAGYALDSEEFETKIQRVPYRTNEQIEAISDIVNALTSYIYIQHIVSARQEGQAFAIMSYIEQNLSDNLSVAALCERFQLPRTSLYQVTRPYMRDGVALFIKQRRLEEAKRLLRATDKSISEIAAAVGFLDENYFRRLFKKEVGVSANVYRKNR